LNWRSVEYLVNTILGRAPFGSPSMISRGVHLSTPQRFCSLLNTGWFHFAETNANAARPAVLGMMSCGLAIISTVVDLFSAANLLSHEHSRRA